MESVGYTWQAMGVLLCLAALLLLLRSYLSRGSAGMLPARSARRLQILESVALGAKQRLHVVRVGDEELLLGSTESSVRLLRRLPPALPELAVVRPKPRQKGWGWAWRRRHALARALPLALLLLLLDATVALAQGITASSEAGQLSISLDGLAAPDQISSTLQIVALLTVISIAPSVLLMGTCFTRLLIVFTLVRQAMGSPSMPPNQVLASLAFFTTLFVMAPVGEAVYNDALLPYMEHELEASEAFDRALEPPRRFLLEHTREKDLLLFVELRGDEVPEDPADVSLATLMPAYLISEIKTAFQIGFMIYLPFLIIDLMIASVTISLGMIMLPPMLISFPFKLILFVVLDGWNLLLSSLVTGLL